MAHSSEAFSEGYIEMNNDKPKLVLQVAFGIGITHLSPPGSIGAQEARIALQKRMDAACRGVSDKMYAFLNTMASEDGMLEVLEHLEGIKKVLEDGSSA